MRLKTHIEDLDDLLGGGIPAGHVVLVMGPPGSLKSTFVFHVIHSNLVHDADMRAAYVTLEQDGVSIIEQMSALGYDVSRIKDRFRIVDWSALKRGMSERTGEWIDAFIRPLRQLKEDVGLDILAVDSLEALYSVADMRNPRAEKYILFSRLKELGATTFCISESRYGDLSAADFREECFLSDGIIHLSIERIGRAMGRYIGILKMRQVNHPMEYYPLLYSDGKFSIVRR
jgi:circadian clock protein KaiC